MLVLLVFVLGVFMFFREFLRKSVNGNTGYQQQGDKESLSQIFMGMGF